MTNRIAEPRPFSTLLGAVEELLRQAPGRARCGR